MAEWYPLSKTVAKRIEEMLRDKGAGGGARLPSQRELSAQFGVSRTAVREALSMLEASGRLRTEPGRGSFMIDRPGARATGAAREIVTGGTTEGGEPPSRRDYPKLEISRLRYLIEGQSARLATMRITDQEIQTLEMNLSTFKEQTRGMDLESSASTDFEFHQLIVEFSGVRLFADLHLAFRDVIMQAVQMYRSQQTRAWEPVAEHEKIIEALKRRDPDEAIYYMHSHIVRSADRLGIINAKEIL